MKDISRSSIGLYIINLLKQGLKPVKTIEERDAHVLYTINPLKQGLKLYIFSHFL